MRDYNEFFETIGLSICIGLIAFFTLLGLAYFAKISIDKSEIVECKEWQEQSAQYTGYYLVRWQKEQCDSHNIIIDTVIR